MMAGTHQDWQPCAPLRSSLAMCWSVAPLHPMSGISHQITFERPLTMALTDHQAYSLDGTPADCVRIALTQLPVAFDWVLSGINNGGNLGSDVYVSGTVAACGKQACWGFRPWPCHSIAAASNCPTIGRERAGWPSKYWDDCCRSVLVGRS